MWSKYINIQKTKVITLIKIKARSTTITSDLLYQSLGFLGRVFSETLVHRFIYFPCSVNFQFKLPGFPWFPNGGFPFKFDEHMHKQRPPMQNLLSFQIILPILCPKGNREDLKDGPYLLGGFFGPVTDMAQLYRSVYKEDP